MENIIDYDELEEKLAAESTDANFEKPKVNSAYLWRTILLMAAIAALTYLVSTVRYTGTGTGWIPPWSDEPSGWNFDYNLFGILNLTSLPNLVIVGLKIEAGQSKALQKKKLLDAKAMEVKALANACRERDAEIVKLKQRLDDASKTHAANTIALQKAEAEVNQPCLHLPQPPQPAGHQPSQK